MNDLTIHDTLTDEEKREVVKQLAEFKDITEVQEFVKTSYSKDLAYNSIKFYLHSKKWKPMLERLRAEFVEPIMDIPVANKYIRLSRCEKLYKLNLEKGNMKECREILNSARTELEGPRNNPSGDVFITQINKFSDEELTKRKQEVLNRIKAIDIGK